MLTYALETAPIPGGLGPLRLQTGPPGVKLDMLPGEVAEIIHFFYALYKSIVTGHLNIKAIKLEFDEKRAAAYRNGLPKRRFAS